MRNFIQVILVACVIMAFSQILSHAQLRSGNLLGNDVETPVQRAAELQAQLQQERIAQEQQNFNNIVRQGQQEQRAIQNAGNQILHDIHNDENEQNNGSAPQAGSSPNLGSGKADLGQPVQPYQPQAQQVYTPQPENNNDNAYSQPQTVYTPQSQNNELSPNSVEYGTGYQVANSEQSPQPQPGPASAPSPIDPVNGTTLSFAFNSNLGEVQPQPSPSPSPLLISDPGPSTVFNPSLNTTGGQETSSSAAAQTSDSETDPLTETEQTPTSEALPNFEPLNIDENGFDIIPPTPEAKSLCQSLLPDWACTGISSGAQYLYTQSGIEGLVTNQNNRLFGSGMKQGTTGSSAVQQVPLDQLDQISSPTPNTSSGKQ